MSGQWDCEAWDKRALKKKVRGVSHNFLSSVSSNARVGHGWRKGASYQHDPVLHNFWSENTKTKTIRVDKVVRSPSFFVHDTLGLSARAWLQGIDELNVTMPNG